jgi:hypothetical protein
MGTLREDIADIQTRLDDSVRTAKLFSHRETYLLIAIGFMRRLLDLYRDVVDQVEHELAPAPKDKARESA